MARSGPCRKALRNAPISRIIEMSKPNSLLLVLLMSLTLQALPALCQNSLDSATEQHKQLREEFKKAEQAAAKMESDNDAGTRDLDKLTRERQSLEADVIHYKGQVTYAQGQLEAAQKNNSPDTEMGTTNSSTRKSQTGECRSSIAGSQRQDPWRRLLRCNSPWVAACSQNVDCSR